MKSKTKMALFIILAAPVIAFLFGWLWTICARWMLEVYP